MGSETRNDERYSLYPCLKEPGYEAWAALHENFFEISSSLVKRTQDKFNISLVTDPYALTEVRHRLFLDVQKYACFPLSKSLNVFMLGGYWTFWLNKLKPFSLREGSPLPDRFWVQYLNEVVAYYIGYWLIWKSNKHRMDLANISPNFFKDFLWNLRYGLLSPESIVLSYKLASRLS